MAEVQGRGTHHPPSPLGTPIPTTPCTQQSHILPAAPKTNVTWASSQRRARPKAQIPAHCEQQTPACNFNDGPQPEDAVFLMHSPRDQDLVM